MSEYQEEPEDKRPMIEKAPLIVLEHRIKPSADAKNTNRIYSKYSTLKAPIATYSNIPNEKELLVAKLDARDYIDLEYGVGRRMHTIADLADKRAAEELSDLHLNLSLRGFGVKESNSATFNQTHTVVEKKARGGSLLKPWTWGK